MPTINATKENLDELIHQNDIVILDFWASWCGPCVNFAPVFEAASERHPNVVFAKVNTEEQLELSKAFKIRSIPNVAIFREQIMMFNNPGSIPAEELDQILSKVSELDMDDVRRQIAEDGQKDPNNN
jgi:thioredoxin